MAYVAECLDDPPPVGGSEFSSCTSVAWVQEVSFSLPNWTISQYGELVTAIWLFWTVMFIVRAIRKHAI